MTSPRFEGETLDVTARCAECGGLLWWSVPCEAWFHLGFSWCEPRPVNA